MICATVVDPKLDFYICKHCVMILSGYHILAVDAFCFHLILDSNWQHLVTQVAVPNPE